MEWIYCLLLIHSYVNSGVGVVVVATAAVYALTDAQIGGNQDMITGFVGIRKGSIDTIVLAMWQCQDRFYLDGIAVVVVVAVGSDKNVIEGFDKRFVHALGERIIREIGFTAIGQHICRL